MRISDSISFPENQDVTSKAGDPNTRRVQSQSDGGYTQDETDFSPDLQKVQELTAQVASLPDVRQERVQELQNAVQSGTYEVDPGKIADAMLTDLAGPTRGSN